MDIAPDLSHLTEDERKIIEAVINRQKAEEKRDAETLQSRLDDYSAPVAMAGRRYSQQIRTNPNTDSVNESGVCCEVCQKTKFVDEQSARQCSICKKRFCVRCGVRLKGHPNNKTFWLCNICRQKQEKYFSTRKFIPTTSSVSQLTHNSTDHHNLHNETTTNISKQYVSDYILSQPFDSSSNDKDDDDVSNNLGAKQKTSPTVVDRIQRKRLLPTAHLRQQEPIQTSKQSTLERDDEAVVSSTESTSPIDDTESLRHETMLANDTWQKEEILAAKLENFLTTPTTTWRWNDTHTEQIGYVHLKNDIHDHGDIFSVLGLKIQGGIRQDNDTMIAEITKVTPGSIADNCGQLQIGDQVLEWNEEKLTNLNAHDVYRIISETSSLQSPDIHMIVKRSIRYPTMSNNDQSSQENDISTNKHLQIQLSFQYNHSQREFLVTIYGARNLHYQQGSFACQLFMQYGRDSLSKEQKCTKPQACSAGICTWNQRLEFFDIDTIDNLSLWIKLVDFDRNQYVLGELCIPVNDRILSDTPEWYSLLTSRANPQLNFLRSDSDVSEFDQQGNSNNRVLPTIQSNNESLSTMIDTTESNNNRKRQLPNIPAAQLHANREKVSQDLIQKATQLKLRLHMQQQQRNENNLNEKRQMYEDRIQIFNNEINRNASSRSNFQSSKSIDTESSHVYQPQLPTKNYESMNNLAQKQLPMNVGLKEKTLSKPRIPIIRDKSAPTTSTPYLNPVLSRRTTSAGQHRVDIEKTKVKSFEEKYRKNFRKRESSETPGDDMDSDGSELSTVSKNSSTSMLSIQSERPRAARKQGRVLHGHYHLHRNDEVQLNEEELRQMAMRSHDTVVTLPTTTTTSNEKPVVAAAAAAASTATAMPPTPPPKTDPRNDGTLSDSVLSTQPESGKKRRPSMSSKALVILGLSKKTNSTSNLGYGKRFGFQRSEEIGVQPHLQNRSLQKQTSKENETPTNTTTQSPLALSHQREQYHSMPHDMKLWSGGLKLPHEHQFAEFIEGLGAGQLVGRQVLASPCHGEIQVGVKDQHGLLEVEIVRARNLLQKAVYKMPPAPYVKVYLLDGKTCLEKQRTRSTRRTLDPLIQQTLIFKENYRDKVLQISIWGDYGKLDRKVFMGVCQINLEDLRLNSTAQVLDWYKLFSANSLMNNYTIVQQSPKRNISMTSNDSFSSFKSNR